MALLHLLLRLGKPRRWVLEVLHFDHGLRGEESDGDRRFVEELAARLGLRCHVERADVRAAAHGENLEQAARRMRYRFFAEVREKRGLDIVATGHTASDQAETVLMRLLKGAGTDSLAGIRPVNDGWIVRPLIEVSREAVREWLRSGGLEWREDASNDDRSYDRNRIRLELLPLLKREWNPAVEEALARVAAASACDEEYWREQVKQVWTRGVRTCRHGVILDAKMLAEVPESLQVRVLKQACAQAAVAPPRFEVEHIEALLQLVKQQRGEGKLSLPGLGAWRSFGKILLHLQNQRLERPDAVELKVPGAAVLERGGQAVRLRRTADVAGLYNGSRVWLDGAKAAGPFVLRPWQKGDAYHPKGRKRGYAIPELFQMERVEAWERLAWPVLEWRGEVIWCRKFGVAEGYEAGPECKFPIEITEEPVLAGA